MYKHTLFTIFLGLWFLCFYLTCDSPFNPDANQEPICNDFEGEGEETVPLKIDLEAQDPDNDYLGWEIASGHEPKYGSIDKPLGTIGEGAEFIYTSHNLPGPEIDTFIITVTDFIVYKSAQVILAIDADNDPPYIPDFDTIRVVRGQEYGIDLPGIDPEGMPVTWEIIDSPSHGTLTKIRDTISDSSEATFISDSSSDSFTYRISDGKSYSPITRAYINSYYSKILQQGFDGYDGCSDISIGKIIAKNPTVMSYLYDNSDSLMILQEC